MVIEIDQHGQITRIDEYYNKKWDEGIGDEQYTVVSGASIAEKGGKE
jgi:hypothetical protein